MAPFTPAPIIVAKTRRIIRRFEDADATSPRNARTPEALNLRHSLILRRLVRAGVIIVTGSGLFYLNRENLSGYLENRRIRVMIMLGVIAVAVIIAVIYNYFKS